MPRFPRLSQLILWLNYAALSAASICNRRDFFFACPEESGRGLDVCRNYSDVCWDTFRWNFTKGLAWLAIKLFHRQHRGGFSNSFPNLMIANASSFSDVSMFSAYYRLSRGSTGVLSNHPPIPPKSKLFNSHYSDRLLSSLLCSAEATIQYNYRRSKKKWTRVTNNPGKFWPAALSRSLQWL